MQLRRKYRLGRVEVVKADGTKFIDGLIRKDPTPEHVGKKGWIIGELYETNMPVIRLDDETLLTGGDCWWVYIGRNNY